MSQYSSRYDEYFQKNKDLQDFWADTSQQGEFAGGQQGKYYENYGVDAAGAEKSFVEGMNKKFGTNNADMRDFTKDQFAQYHYDTYGAKEGRQMKSAQEFLDSKLPKPEDEDTKPITETPTPPNTSIGDGNEFGEGERIGNNVGKVGNITTSIGNNNTFGDNATIGNDFSTTIGGRSEAVERAKNYQGFNSTPPPISSSGSTDENGNVNVSVGYEGTNGTWVEPNPSKNSYKFDPSNPSTQYRDTFNKLNPQLNSENSSGGQGGNTVNNTTNVGKRGDMNSSIGNNNTFGNNANIGNDYSVTIGGSGDRLSNMQRAVAYSALNTNDLQRSKSQLSGETRSQQAIDQSRAGGWLQMAANAYNLVGMSAQNSYDMSTIGNARLFGDYYNRSYNFNPPPFRSPEQPESKVQEILDGFKK